MKTSITFHPKNTLEMDKVMALLRTLETPDVAPKPDPIEEEFPREDPPDESDKAIEPAGEVAADRAGWTQKAGWAQWPLAAGARQIFVSTSGYDRNNGLNVSSPVKTIAAGVALLTDGAGDHLLLKRGDKFLKQDFGEWTKSGKSRESMLLIGAYGDETRPRPVIQPSPGSQILVGREGTKCSHVAMCDLHFLVSEGHDGSIRPPHIVWRAEGRCFHVEGCFFAGTVMIAQRIAGHGPVEEVIFRRNVVDQPFAKGGRVHIYWQGVTGGLLEENFLYHLGWSPTVADDKYTHNCYVTHDCTGIVFRRNISMSSSSHGVQLRCGGVMDENVFIDTALQSFGYVLGGSQGSPDRNGGVSGSIRDNLFIDPKKIDGVDRGTGVQVGNINSLGLELRGNMFLNDTRSGEANSCAIELDPDNGPAGLCNVTIADNTIYNWRCGLVIQDSNYPATVSGMRIHGNRWTEMRGSQSMPTFVAILGPQFPLSSFANNEYCKYPEELEVGYRVGGRTRYADHDFDWWYRNAEPSATAERVSYPNPDRTIESYSENVDGGGLLGFIEGCISQQKTSWRADYTAVSILNYFREGFGKNLLA